MTVLNPMKKKFFYVEAKPSVYVAKHPLGDGWLKFTNDYEKAKAYDFTPDGLRQALKMAREIYGTVNQGELFKK